MDDNEWETIQPPSSASQSDSDDSGTVVVTTPTNFTTHHNLPLLPQQPDHLQQPPSPPSPPSSHSSSTTPYTTEIAETDTPHPQPQPQSEPPEVTSSLLKASLGVLSSWVLRIGYGVRSRIGFWSVAYVGVFVAVVVYARRWQRLQRWRRLKEKDHTDKLLMLLNQKDEKIKQLLLQIDRMNEALSVRRRVPVIRVMVDSPVVIGPRLN